MSCREKEESPTSPHYILPKTKKGLVVVFNYTFSGKDDDEWFRKGSKEDSKTIQALFADKFGYEVLIREDFSRESTFDELYNITKNKLVGMGSLLLFFLSHGDTKRGPNFFHTNGWIEENDNQGELDKVREYIAVPEIYSVLTDSKCPVLKGKPKLIFLNFCRGSAIEIVERVHTDFIPNYIKAPADVAIIQATLPGIRAFRHPQHGTHFVRFLCEILEEHGSTKHLQEIVILLKDRMDELIAQNKLTEATTPSIELIGFRKLFYFNK